MATKQTSGSETRKSETARGAGVRRGGPARTGERDENYDLISILYHSLQGAETCQQYIADARDASDRDLASFFEDTRSELSARAAQAKELLASRLGGAATSDIDDEDLEEDDVDEDDDED